VIFVFGIHCNMNTLGIDILLTVQWEQNSEMKGVFLKSLRFFENKQNLLKYSENNSLEIINERAKLSEPIFKSLLTLKQKLIEFGSGKKVDLGQTVHNLNLLKLKTLFSTKFSRKIIKYLITNVKYGDIVSYSDIGKGIHSRAYQAIGTVLKNNPLPLIIPCHRVIRKDGSIGGFLGKTSKDNGWQINLKKKLLELEKSY